MHVVELLVFLPVAPDVEIVEPSLPKASWNSIGLFPPEAHLRRGSPPAPSRAHGSEKGLASIATASDEMQVGVPVAAFEPFGHGRSPIIPKPEGELPAEHSKAGKILRKQKCTNTWRINGQIISG
jgi:hypothetical protein